MDMDMLKAIVGALRSGRKADRRVYKEGKLFRTEPVPTSSLIESMNKRKRAMEYDKYRIMQERMGETPVSYQEYE